MSRILHIEDEHIWRDFVKKALADHHVDSAASFDEALHHLQSSAPYDLALVDLHLIDSRDLSGGEILDLLRARYPSTRRVVVTGRPQGSVRADIFERYEVEEIIIKGEQLTLPGLRRVVEGALDQAMREVPQNVKLHKSELRQHLRDWERSQERSMSDEIRRAEEHLRNAEKLHEGPARRAQEALTAVKNQRNQLEVDCSAVENLIDQITDIEDFFKVSGELEQMQAKYTGGTSHP